MPVTVNDIWRRGRGGRGARGAPRAGGGRGGLEGHGGRGGRGRRGGRGGAVVRVKSDVENVVEFAWNRRGIYVAFFLKGIL